MISERKMQANKLNAQKSTGPRSDDGKAVVSLNAITHGLRARHAVMLIEDPVEFKALCQTLYDEWQPMTPTEAHLLENAAVCQWKMGRMEALISSSNMQSAFMHLAFKNVNQYRTEKGTIELPDLSQNPDEQKVQTMLNGIQRHQQMLEKSYYHALSTLEHIQAMRRKKLGPQPMDQAVEKPKVMAAGAGAGWNIEIQRDPKSPARRRFGNAWQHKSGLPADVKLEV